jgi:hypothetical protein
MIEPDMERFVPDTGVMHVRAMAKVAAVFTVLEEKVVRRVRDSAYWGRPKGTPITPGMKPVKDTIPVRVLARPHTVSLSKEPPTNEEWSEIKRKFPNLNHYRDGGMGGVGPDRSVVGMVSTARLAEMPGNGVRRGAEIESFDPAKMTDPIMVEFDPDNGRMFVGEGNHRVLSAAAAGVDELPVRLVRSWISDDKVKRVESPTQGGKVAQITMPESPWKQRTGTGEKDYWPTDLHPSYLFGPAKPRVDAAHEPEPTITHAWVHYGDPMVTVEPYRTTDKRGFEVEVREFWRDSNGSSPVAQGFKIKKNGETASGRVTLLVTVPKNVADELDRLLREKNVSAAKEPPRKLTRAQHDMMVELVDDWSGNTARMDATRRRAIEALAEMGYVKIEKDSWERYPNGHISKFLLVRATPKGHAYVHPVNAAHEPPTMPPDMSRAAISRTLRKAGLQASKRVGMGYTNGYDSWPGYGGVIFVHYRVGTGNASGGSDDVEKSKNAEILAALKEAGYNAAYSTEHPDGRIEVRPHVDAVREPNAPAAPDPTNHEAMRQFAIAEDTKSAELYAQEQPLLQRRALLFNDMHRTAGHKRNYGQQARYQPWTGTDQEALDGTRAKAFDTSLMAHEYEGAQRTIEKYEANEQALKELHEKMDAQEATYRKYGWSRAFLAITNGDGHVHSSMRCPTCNRGVELTQFAWMTEYSGSDESEIVDAAGVRACTVCYPSAPVESLNKPTRMFSPDEIDKAKAREERAKAKDEKARKKIADAATADGSELVVQTSYGREVFKTERSAMSFASEHYYNLYEDDKPRATGANWIAIESIANSLAAKRGVDVSEVFEEIVSKANAKKKKWEKEAAAWRASHPQDGAKSLPHEAPATWLA